MKKRALTIVMFLALVFALIPVAVLESVEAADTSAYVLVKAAPSGSKNVKLSWNKVKGANKYVVYAAKGNSKKLKKIYTTKKTSYKVSKIKGSKLKSHEVYRFYVVAYKGNKKLAKSSTVATITAKTKGKYANATKVTVKTKSMTLKVGETFKADATVKLPKGKKHLPTKYGAKFSYLSTNPDVASVSSKGVITAKKEGNATIYVQDLCGINGKIVVTVTKADTPTPAPTAGPTPTPEPTLSFKVVAIKNTMDLDLVFYYDKKDHSKDANIYGVYDNLPANAESQADWGYNDIRKMVGKVVIDESVKEYKELKSINSMFYGMEIAKSIEGAEYLDVSNVTDMESAFAGFGYSVTKFNSVPDVSNWDTKNVKNMKDMFFDYGYSSIELIDVPSVEGWDTSSVTDMNKMFAEYGHDSKKLSSAPRVDGEKWRTDKVTDMSYMFARYGSSSESLNFNLELYEWNIQALDPDKGDGVFEDVGKDATCFKVYIYDSAEYHDNDYTKWYYNKKSNWISPRESATFSPAG